MVSALTEAGGPVALTTGLVGAGGFGKTMLAERACQDRAVRRRFPGGVCWVTVGRELDGERLAQRISEAVWNLGGEGRTFASLEEAGRALTAALAARSWMLLVADDVWTSGQLAPFVTAGQAGRLLVTTRRPAVLAGTAARRVEV
ncbi:MAG: NB-ARC domain-containing protein, partial [Streptosporangiaceae bacterium]